VPRLNRIEDYLQQSINLEALPELVEGKLLEPAMVTLEIDGGRKDKLRPGDILGALTKDAGLKAEVIGKINIFDFCSYVALNRTAVKQALQHLQTGKLKGRRFRVRMIK
jgi:ATP-independent RNA helicase DbpA